MAKPKKTLTAEQIKQIPELAAALNQEQLAAFFGMSHDTFRRRCLEDETVMRAYEKGRAKAAKDIAESLLSQARKGNTTAQIFYLKTQCGWRETDKHEIEGGISINVVRE